jgi:hypothetical protein
VDDEARQLKREWQRGQKAAARAAFPLSTDRLEALFQHVEHCLENRDCDHTLQISRAWLTDNGIDPEPVVAWLKDNGGYCDCEVMYNAADHFESNRD